MPQSIVWFDILLLAVIVIQLSKAEYIQSELQAIIVVKEFNATSNGEHNVCIVLDGQGMDNTGVFANPISWASNPIVSTSRSISKAAIYKIWDRHTPCNPILLTW
jgi:hypothetical protein